MLNELNASLNLIIEQTQYNFRYLCIIVAIPWGIYLLSVFNQNLLLLGVIPRRLFGIQGIFFAPLVHANFNHIFFNTIPLVVLSNFILIHGLGYYLDVTCTITILSGLGIWLFAKDGLHIGASALITGYWGFLIINIYQDMSLTTIILGLLSLYYFAGIFFGIFPSKKGVSWEGHLFGLIAGFATSYCASHGWLVPIHQWVI